MTISAEFVHYRHIGGDHNAERNEVGDGEIEQQIIGQFNEAIDSLIVGALIIFPIIEFECADVRITGGDIGVETADQPGGYEQSPRMGTKPSTKAGMRV